MAFLQRPDTKLWYETHGEGPPLLFMSETACHGEIWKRFQVPYFSGAFKVVIYDQRGTGRSDPFLGPLSTRLLAEDAAALLDEIGAPAANVVGHSMGGRVAQWLALDHPEKVARLVFASSGAAHRNANGLPLSLAAGMIEQGYDPFQRQYVLERAFTEDYRRDHPDQVAVFMETRFARRPPVMTYLQYIVARTAHDTESRLGEIRAPTLVLYGDKETHKNAPADLNHIESSQILAAKIPGAKVLVLPGQNHCYFYTAPEQFNAVVSDFLKERRA